MESVGSLSSVSTAAGFRQLVTSRKIDNYLYIPKSGARKSRLGLETAPRLITETLRDVSSRKGRLVTCCQVANEVFQVEGRKKDDGASPWKVAIEVNTDEERIEPLVEEIKEIFRSMNDGETSPSAYDTAWVARIPAVDSSDQPQFPTTLDWILNNQLDDGSWGEPSFFLLFDRLICTLACVLTLTHWKKGEDQVQKGLKFLREQAGNMEKEAKGLITCGFEIAFPSMLDEARSLGLDLPYDLPYLKEIVAFREKKIKRIPIEVVHSVHTTLLYSLEALQEVVQWDKILKLQSSDGSFLSAPSSTAVAFMKTGDKKCLEFLTYIVRRFGDHAPAQYPIDLLERIWAVDTIQRLGIDHHFRKEISDTLDYVYRNAGKRGVSWGRDNPIADVDDTCMAFRLMRMHGYPVSPDVLEHFKDDNGNFICFPGETHTGVSDMFNLYRFSQMSFPREKILKEAKAFAEEHLRTCLENNTVEDKWSVKKALHKEVDRAIRFPWRMSLQRLEAREYIHHYGEKDVWIAKDIYKMPYVNNPKYLELAKLDYNKLQTIYCREYASIQRWWNSCGFNDLSFEQPCPKEIYFSIAATIYEPQFSTCRMAYTKCNCIETVISDLFENHESIEDLKMLCLAVEKWDPLILNSLSQKVKVGFKGMYETLNELATLASKAQGKDMFGYLHSLRVRQIKAYLNDRELKEAKCIPSLNKYLEHGKMKVAVDMRVIPAMFFMGENLHELVLQQLDHRSRIYDQLCTFLRLFEDIKTFEIMGDSISYASAVSCCAREENCSEKEAIDHLKTMLDDAFDELIHEYLKPSRVPQHCRKLMFEYARITQFFLSNVGTDPTSTQSEMIENEMNSFFRLV